MDCVRTANLLDRYLDRELNRADLSMVKRHLESCGECSRAFDARSCMTRAIKKDATYHPAPAALAKRIRAQIAQQAAENAAPQRARPFKIPNWSRWLPLAAAFATVMLATSLVTVELAAVPEDDRIVSELLSGHSRAMLTAHEIDVVSSDQHTVKPWLSSKLDFSPIVLDLSASGFPLRGGRLDYVNGRPVAVLVYGHAQHLVDLFIWPEDAAADARVSRTLSKRGVNLVRWNDAGMTYWAVSDITKADLESFAQRYASAR